MSAMEAVIRDAERRRSAQPDPSARRAPRLFAGLLPRRRSESCGRKGASAGHRENMPCQVRSISSKNLESLIFKNTARIRRHDSRDLQGKDDQR
jgi:hypothetical protein